MADIQSQIADIISRISKIPSGGFSVEDDLVVKFGIDSMQRIEILIEMEKNFGITIPDEEANNLRTLLDFVTIAEKHKGVKK